MLLLNGGDLHADRVSCWKTSYWCDAGGSNGDPLRLWKKQIQERLADALGLEVMVCHYPIGASRWNPIEHRLFSYISLHCF